MAEQTISANKALWEKGDFTRIAEKMREHGREIVAELGLEPGMRVLDVGCGDGTTAIPAAETGADVLGVDISAPLVAAGNAPSGGGRPDECPLPGRGDASDLRDLPDDSFDVVISIFGAMFAPRAK